jgi:hypothetical protein
MDRPDPTCADMSHACCTKYPKSTLNFSQRKFGTFFCRFAHRPIANLERRLAVTSPCLTRSQANKFRAGSSEPVESGWLSTARHIPVSGGGGLISADFDQAAGGE